MPATLLLAVLFPVLSMKNLRSLLLIYTGISFALIVDLGTVWLLWAMSKGSLNVRAAFLYNLTDAAASVAVIAGGAAVYWLSWDWVDPALTLVIAGYILYMSFGLIRKTSSILMERAPEDLDLDKLKTTVEQVDGVVGMHHLHVWELNEDHRAMEAHIELESDDADRKRIRREIKSMLKNKFDIAHSTLELESPSDRDACSDNELFPEHG